MSKISKTIFYGFYPALIRPNQTAHRSKNFHKNKNRMIDFHSADIFLVKITSHSYMSVLMYLKAGETDMTSA